MHLYKLMTFRLVTAGCFLPWPLLCRIIRDKRTGPSKRLRPGRNLPSTAAAGNRLKYGHSGEDRCYNFRLLRGYGEIGRRTRFRFLRSNLCQFESDYPHQYHATGAVLLQVQYYATGAVRHPLPAPASWPAIAPASARIARGGARPPPTRFCAAANPHLSALPFFPDGL